MSQILSLFLCIANGIGTALTKLRVPPALPGWKTNRPPRRPGGWSELGLRHAGALVRIEATLARTRVMLMKRPPVHSPCGTASRVARSSPNIGSAHRVTDVEPRPGGQPSRKYSSCRRHRLRARTRVVSRRPRGPNERRRIDLFDRHDRFGGRRLEHGSSRHGAGRAGEFPEVVPDVACGAKGECRDGRGRIDHAAGRQNAAVDDE